MPKSTHHTPSWTAYAHNLLARLRRHHGTSTTHSSEALNAKEPSELDELFAKFEIGNGAEHFSGSAELSSRYVPARHLLTAIRIGATIGSDEVEQKSRQCGALTVVHNIRVEELTMVKDTLIECYPRSAWHIIAPDLTDGTLSKNAQTRFCRAIADSLDRIEPVLILQTNGVALPKNLQILKPPILPLAPINRDVLTYYLQSGRLSDQIGHVVDLRTAMPKDEALAELCTTDACAALRTPTLCAALINIGQMARPDRQSSGPRLEDMTGDSPALMAARRLVDDLLLWRQGKTGWHEISRSMLLYGPPGTGKSWLAQAMGNSGGIHVVVGSFGAWQAAGHLGDMLREMRASFAEARRRTPCLLIIDEIDAVGSRSENDRHASNYRTQVITTFLSELDAISREEGVILVGTCNHIERIDPAVLRAGRIDLKINVPLPDAEALLAILRHHLHEDIADNELRDLARLVVGHSAAELDAAIRAARSDARHSRKMLSLMLLREHFNIGPDSQNSGVLWRIAVHEAGHAIMATALHLGAIDSMHITTRGGSILRQSAPHQSLLSDIESEIIYSMGGRAAERLVFGEVSAGAGGPEASDLAKATRYAVDIETTFGIGYEGPVWHAKPNEVHLGTTAIRDRVRQRLLRAEQKAGKILVQHRDILEGLARELLQKRSMRTAEIALWLRGAVATPSESSTKLLLPPTS